MWNVLLDGKLYSTNNILAEAMAYLCDPILARHVSLVYVMAQ